MKTNWLGLSVLILLSALLAGCPPAEEAQAPQTAKKAAAAKEAEEAKKAEEARKAEEAKAAEMAAGLDQTKLPPPRSSLNATPDLYEATLSITDQGLARMKEDGVPDDVIAALGALKGREFGNATEFLNAVRDIIGADKTAEHQLAILRNSASINMATAPAFPGTLLGLARDTRFEVVYFDYDRSEIKPEFMETIKANAQVLLDNANMKVTIEGHCDERGTTEYNLALGQRRANAVRQAMIDLGVKPEQMKTVSFGEERPADPRSNEDAWAKNRRSAVISAG